MGGRKPGAQSQLCAVCDAALGTAQHPQLRADTMLLTFLQTEPRENMLNMVSLTASGLRFGRTGRGAGGLEKPGS